MFSPLAPADALPGATQPANSSAPAINIAAKTRAIYVMITIFI